MQEGKTVADYDYGKPYGKKPIVTAEKTPITGRRPLKTTGVGAPAIKMQAPAMKVVKKVQKPRKAKVKGVRYVKPGGVPWKSGIKGVKKSRVAQFY